MFSREQLANFTGNQAVINTDGEQKKWVDNTAQSTEQSEEKNTAQPSPQASPQYKMSSSDSISSYLITAWLNKEIGVY